MALCMTCGMRAPAGRGAAVPVPPEEELGRCFFGLPRDAQLCPECLEDVRLTGTAVYETEYASYCPGCRTLWHEPARERRAPHRDAFGLSAAVYDPAQPGPAATRRAGRYA